MLLLVGTACNKGNKTNQGEESDSAALVEQAGDVPEQLAFDSCQWKDSVSFGGENVARVDFSCIYPKAGSQQLVDSINYWICEEFGDTLHKHHNDIKRLLSTQGRQQLKSDSKELKAMLDEGAPDYVSYESDIDISVEYEDADYITMNMQSYYYLGGAHGSSYAAGTTFRKSDGRRMGWLLLDGMSLGKLRKSIKSGLKEYFEVKTDQELLECLLIGDPFDDNSAQQTYDRAFPLPDTPPYLNRNGINIIYQQYEIAPYAAGMPSCVIPTSSSPSSRPAEHR